MKIVYFSVRVTNRKQFEHLVSRMEAHPTVAKGLKFSEASGVSQDAFVSVWKELAAGLNSLGPPIRTVKDWQKVWTDYKLKVKHKLAHNKREVNATGGGPNNMKVLSPCEEAVVEMLSLDKTVNHSGSAFGLPRRPPPSASPLVSQPSLHPSPPGSPLLSSTMRQQTISADEADQVECDRGIRDEGIENSHSPARRKRKQSNTRDVRHELLMEQTKCMQKIVEHTGDCARYARKMCKLREEEVKNRKEYLLQKEKDRKADLEYKIELLQYKKKKLDILERQYRKK
ncbi:uncharacterized protein LOC115269191 isoform X1 [Aedes albopictus]|uniref:Regulatory protein zeste n=1 Tax=Aedes albopictus TaxID=7160 RepID=A0ABM1ZI12_AEDAL|nr:uncharacterized protein LOC115266641 isoform X1 [Aedes albopictus]XP_029733468.1 uncharacterized protein LOC115269191 isoform X1 [Aedes albopictus]